ncbi:MAG: hypothetical protein Q4F42_05490 [Rikenellaceae bacterium]|nr:hypothetical protein [Rikenellaceae bacterium]MDO5487915.1 hypothetical protein [Rikenellaceae bacterium]
MDTRDNMELTELREQVALLKEKLMRQQIISEQNIIAAAQKGISQLNKAGNIWGIFGIFAVVYCSWSFHRFGFSDGFVIGTAIFLAICAAVTIYAHWGIRSIDVANGNLVDISQRLISFRKIYSRYHLFSIPALLVWCYFLYQDAQHMLEYAEGFLIAGCVGGLIGAIIGLKAHFKVIRDTDKVLKNINELLQHK